MNPRYGGQGTGQDGPGRPKTAQAGPGWNAVLAGGCRWGAQDAPRAPRESTWSPPGALGRPRVSPGRPRRLSRDAPGDAPGHARRAWRVEGGPGGPSRGPAGAPRRLPGSPAGLIFHWCFTDFRLICDWRLMFSCQRSRCTMRSTIRGWRPQAGFERSGVRAFGFRLESQASGFRLQAGNQGFKLQARDHGFRLQI